MSDNYSINQYSAIQKMNIEELESLFRNALVEALKVEAALIKIIESRDRIVQYRVEQADKSAVSPGAAAALFLLDIVPGIIYLASKSKNKSKYENLITGEYESIKSYKEEARTIANQCAILPRIPSDYRTPLALQTMIRFIINGQAENWKECANRYDEQLHRWILERNSTEALQLQRYSTIMTELIAISTARTASVTSFSAANDILSWL